MNTNDGLQFCVTADSLFNAAVCVSLVRSVRGFISLTWQQTNDAGVTQDVSGRYFRFCPALARV